VNIDPTRIGTYRRILAELEEKHRRGLIDELLAKHGFAIVANVLFESTEVVDIYEGLSGLDQDVSGSLRKFTAGCTLLTDERRRGKMLRGMSALS